MALVFTDKERTAIFWVVAFLTLGAALKAHQVHAKRWGDAFMAPPPLETAFGAKAESQAVSKPESLPESKPDSNHEGQGAVMVLGDSIAAESEIHQKHMEERVKDKPARKNDRVSASPCSVAVNTASASELMDLPGVGEKMAMRILAHREKKGRFRKADDLLAVKGIGQKKLDRMRGCLIL